LLRVQVETLFRVNSNSNDGPGEVPGRVLGELNVVLSFGGFLGFFATGLGEDVEDRRNIGAGVCEEKGWGGGVEVV